MSHSETHLLELPIDTTINVVSDEEVKDVYFSTYPCCQYQHILIFGYIRNISQKCNDINVPISKSIFLLYTPRFFTVYPLMTLSAPVALTEYWCQSSHVVIDVK